MKKRLIFLLVFVPNLCFASALTPTNVIRLTNLSRAEYNLPPLKANWRLNLSADSKALSMVKSNYFSHTSPSGIQFYWWIYQMGYNFSKAGENLARGFKTTEDMEKAFMQSKTHRENILNPVYTEIGVSVRNGIVVEHFGRLN